MSALPDDAGPVLLKLARAAIAAGLGLDASEMSETLGTVLFVSGLRQKEPSPMSHLTTSDPVPAWLRQPGASFVTLTIAGDLRGCIGSLTAYQPLGRDVQSNARAAAFDDPRFPPLSANEFGSVHIEVSVLSAPKPMPFASQADALAALRPGTDGVVLFARGRRATFLPQVWEELPDRAQFIRHLMAKAGLPPDYWGDDVRIDRYTVTAFEEVAGS